MSVDVVVFPNSLCPDMQSLVPDAPNQSFQESEFSASQNVINPHGNERWRLRMNFNDLTGDDRAELMGTIVKLRVSRNVFLCVNHTASQRGAWSNAAVQVNSISNGVDLTLGNASPSVSSYVRLGDTISVNSALKMVTSDAGTDGSGIVTFPVWPPFGLTPDSGTLAWFDISSAMGAFRLIRATPLNTTPPGYRTSISIDAVERVNSSYVSDF